MIDAGTRHLLAHPRTAGRLDILFVGDTAFGEGYQRDRAALGLDNILESRGYLACFEGLAGLLAQADVVVANLETPLSHRDPPAGSAAIRWRHKGDPGRSATALRALGLQAVSLANNHMGDLGAAGITDTLAVLNRWEIIGFGAGQTEAEARAPLIIESTGEAPLRCAVVAGDAGRWAGLIGDHGGARPATAALRIGNARARLNGLTRPGRRFPVVAFPHWGANYQWATPLQRRLGTSLLGAGADLILGHGAHCLQEIERQAGRWIVYSLGNFMFASPGRYNRFKAPPYSLAARLRLAADADGRTRITGLRLYPIVSDNRRTDYRPRPVTREEAADVRRLFADRCPATAGLPWRSDRAGIHVDLIAPRRRRRSGVVAHP